MLLDNYTKEEFDSATTGLVPAGTYIMELIGAEGGESQDEESQSKYIQVSASPKCKVTKNEETGEYEYDFCFHPSIRKRLYIVGRDGTNNRFAISELVKLYCSITGLTEFEDVMARIRAETIQEMGQKINMLAKNDDQEGQLFKAYVKSRENTYNGETKTYNEMQDFRSLHESEVELMVTTTEDGEVTPF